MSPAPRVRIAPSPTGDPHVGTAYVALFNRAVARAGGGSFVLRIDDTDRARYQAGAEESIFRALRWLGLDWDEGPDKGGPHAPYRQSERTSLYRDAAERLVSEGSAYRCFCTAERLAALREEKGLYGYDGHCRGLSAGEVEAQLGADAPHTVRLKVPDDGATSFTDGLRGVIEWQNAEIDDQILLKSDGFPTYHLANVVDDSAMGITHVIRAEEWISSAAKHVLIYRALGEPLPLFYHVPLLRNEDHSKISKRKNPVSLDFYREQGYLPEALLNFLAHLGWSSPEGEEVFDTEHFERHFRLDDITTGGPVFDLTKLQWLNGVYIRKLPIEDLTARLRDGGFIPESVTADAVATILPLVAERLHLLSDFEELTRFYFHGARELERDVLIPKKLEAADGLRLLASLEENLGGVDDWRAEPIEAAVERVREQLELKKPQTFMPLRMAVTGQRNSPPIFEVLEILGRDECVARLRAAGEHLAAG